MSNTADVIAVVAEVVRLASFVAGLYLTVGVVMAAVHGHLGKVAGVPGVGADVGLQVVLITICFTFAVTAGDIGGQVAAMVTAASTADEAGAMWRRLAEFIVRTVIIVTGASTTIAAANSGLAAQAATLLGLPNAATTSAVRMVVALGGGGLTLLSATLADSLVKAVLG